MTAELESFVKEITILALISDVAKEGSTNDHEIGKFIIGRMQERSGNYWNCVICDVKTSGCVNFSKRVHYKMADKYFYLFKERQAALF